MGSQKKGKTIKKAISALIILIGAIGCATVKPGAVQVPVEAKIANLETQLQKLTEQNNTIEANNIGKIKNSADNKLLENKKEIGKGAGTINFSGAGYVVLGSSIMVALFLFAIGWYVRQLMKKKTDLLKLVTCAIQKTDPAIREAVKSQIEYEVSNGGPYDQKHKQELAVFTKKHGTFADKVK